MTIASEIQRIKDNIADAYTSCQSKGATMPVSQVSDNLANCIDTIQTGSTPVISSLNVTPTTTSQTITAPSGTDGYSPISVSAVTSTIDSNIVAGNIKKDVSILGVTGTYEGSGGATKYGATINNVLGDIDANGVLKVPTSANSFDFECEAESLGPGVDFRNFFYFNNGITSLSFPNLLNAPVNSYNYCCNNAQNLESIDFSSLQTINGANAFSGAFGGTKVTSVSFPELVSVTGSQAFYLCFQFSKLSSISFPKLEQIGENTSSTNYGHFSSCFDYLGGTNTGSTAVKITLTFPELTTIYCTGGSSTMYGTFYQNQSVTKMYFPKLDTITYGSGASSTNQRACNNVFYGCSSLTELHFGAANQSAIEASPGYSTAWGRGAGNVTIYFDL